MMPKRISTQEGIQNDESRWVSLSLMEMWRVYAFNEMIEKVQLHHLTFVTPFDELLFIIAAVFEKFTQTNRV